MTHPFTGFAFPPFHGPIIFPFINMSGEEKGTPNDPAHYGRYLAIDLDENNRHQIDSFRDRHPGKPVPHFGWGVCRQGFGLQDLPPMDETTANEIAKSLNASTPIGVIEDPRDAQDRLAAVRDEIWSVT